MLSMCVALLTILIADACLAVDGAAPPRKPNIVFILADDLGWTDLGSMGSRYYETPHIDRLASEGVRFMNYHNCQNCTPTRAAILSGQYPPRTGVYTVATLARGRPDQMKLLPPVNRTFLPPDVDTLADQLKAAGYATGMFGKWHLDDGPGNYPSQRGFDKAIVAAGRHFNFKTRPPVDYPPRTYMADFLTDHAVHFIEEHKDRPFFLYLPHFGVHSPHQAKSDLIDRFKTRSPAGGHHDPVYAAMIFSVDQSVGRVMDTLRRLGLADNTLVVFSSDNGGTLITSNAPLRGFKGNQYEGGLRVPFIVRGPGVGRRGSQCHAPTIHVDVFPTFLEIAGAPAPRQPLDGRSLVPLLRDPAARLDRQAIYFHFPGYLEGHRDATGWRATPTSTIIAGNWKLLEFFEDDRVELYDLARDLGESNDLAARMPDKVRELKDMLTTWRHQVAAPVPPPNPDYKPPATPAARS
jgi:arylsulfatase A-like enzyme